MSDTKLGQGRHRVAVTAWSAAPVEAVWALLVDVPSWRRWAGVKTATYDREGVPAPGGVGAIRRVGAGPVVAREQIVEFDAPTHMAYTVVSGPLPTTNYLAHVELREERGGTAISWHSTFDLQVRGTGPLVRAALRAVLGRLARRLARAAAG